MKLSFLLILIIVITNSHNIHEQNAKQIVTYVTGFWSGGAEEKQDVQNLRAKLLQMLAENINMIIYGSDETKSFVEQKTKSSKYQFIVKDVKELRNFWYNKQIYNLKQEKNFNDLQYIMIQLLGEAQEKDSFNSDYLVWVDLQSKTPFTKTTDEIIRSQTHFFFKEALNKSQNIKFEGFQSPFIQKDMKVFADTSFFGGRAEALKSISTLNNGLLKLSLEKKHYLSFEEIASLLAHNTPFFISYLREKENGSFVIENNDAFADNRYLFQQKPSTKDHRVKEVLQAKKILEYRLQRYASDSAEANLYGSLLLLLFLAILYFSIKFFSKMLKKKLTKITKPRQEYPGDISERQLTR